VNGKIILMLEEPWINQRSDKLDDGTIFPKSSKGQSRDPLLCGGCNEGRYGDYIFGYRSIPAFKVWECKFHMY
jgi:hypothetical protein